VATVAPGPAAVEEPVAVGPVAVGPVVEQAVVEQAVVEPVAVEPVAVGPVVERVVEQVVAAATDRKVTGPAARTGSGRRRPSRSTQAQAEASRRIVFG
jgi:hypothetical protein